ncbi:MAG TPA: DNA polymerase ligase N-terminal domain-containing protein [Lacipirellula sp.]
MSLTEYKLKRDFSKTPEPGPKVKHSRSGSQFVVQKHAASRLHYDFRLELNGTLKSWAVPKGPSLDPSVKALAVHVEDHPLDYASFEGVIPQGEYGGGTVMVWDRGTWEPEGGEDAAKAYRKGRLKFALDGEKLKGSWALIRMGGRAGDDGKNWLLIKHDDKYAKPSDEYVLVEKRPKSVVSKRTIEQIAKAADRVWSSNRSAAAKKSKKHESNGATAMKTSKKAKKAKRAVNKLAASTKKRPAAKKKAAKKAGRAVKKK